MKVGIITFHWAANYGAILQAYSLVEYLRNQYCANVEIIDYCPSNLALSYKNAIKHIRPNVVWAKIREVQKNKIVSPFRRQLPLSKRYYSNQELICSDMTYDIILTGSDQIWNPSFLLHGERRITPAYYLDFADEFVKKIAISASFGCYELPKECNKIVIPLLQQFSGLSVRENTGKEILHSLGFESVTVTADPTALTSSERYLKMCNPERLVAEGGISKFILRKQPMSTKRLVRKIVQIYSKKRAANIDFLSVPDWLASIRDSKLVITNSFHCVMMCLKLHTPFAVVLEKGTRKGMNDRFFTLLKTFQLTDRIVENDCDIKKLSETIDFEKVDILMKEYSSTLESFIARHLGEVDRIP